MPSTPLDAAEAARVLLTESEALSRAIRRLAPLGDPLERAAATLAADLVAGRDVAGAELLRRYGAVSEALAGVRAALDGVEDGLGGMRFVHVDGEAPSAALRARAVDELRGVLGRRRGGVG